MGAGEGPEEIEADQGVAAGVPVEPGLVSGGNWIVPETGLLKVSVTSPGVVAAVAAW